MAINVSVRLTDKQLGHLINLLDKHFVEAIKNSEEELDMEYVCEMADVYNKFKKVQAKAAEPADTHEAIVQESVE